MKVLYATDGLEPAIRAAQFLEKLADRSRIDLTVMSVTHSGIPAPEHAPFMLDAVELRRKDTMKLVDAATEKLVVAGFRARGHTAEGHPGQEIVRAVEDEWYDLVILGAGGRSWLGNRLLGSVSSYVLHSSPRSVLIVHDSLPGDGNASVLLGTDGSQGARITTQTLAEFADTERTKIEVVSVAEAPSPMFFAVPGAAYVPPDAYKQEQEIHKQIRERADRCASRAASELRDSGFEVEARVTDGNPTEQLLKEADRGKFDLVAVGSRGLGPFRRALLGSVSDHLVRHSSAALVGRRLTS